MTLGDVHVNADGTIRHNGEPIGTVLRVEPPSPIGKWRAEIGDPRACEAWPAWRAVYAGTRKVAVASAIEDLEVPA